MVARCISIARSPRQDAAPAFPQLLHQRLEKVHDLRYGENPHQRAAFYRDPGSPSGLAGARQLHGKELSYNNLLDLEAAWRVAQEFTDPVVAIVKHNNPCGVATGEPLLDAYSRAHAADPVSAYGGIIALNRVLDAETAQRHRGNLCRGGDRARLRGRSLDCPAPTKNVRLLVLPTGRRSAATRRATPTRCAG